MEVERRTSAKIEDRSFNVTDREFQEPTHIDDVLVLFVEYTWFSEHVGFLVQI